MFDSMRRVLDEPGSEATMDAPKPTFRSIFLPWLWAYVGCLLAAGMLLIPVVLAIGAYQETQTPRVVEMIWNKVGSRGDPRSKFPADDSMLRQWFREQDPGLQVTVERSTPDEGMTRISVRWRGRVEQGSVPFGDLGYIQANDVSKSSAQSRYKLRAQDGLLLAYMFASLGFLGFGVRYWRRRQPRPATTTLRTALVKGAGLGFLCFAAGSVGLLGSGLGGCPHLLGWPIAMYFGGTLLKCLTTLAGVLLIPTAWELFFRQGLYARAAAAGHERRAAVVSSALFAFPLCLLPVGCVVLFLHGFACCWVYRSTGRLAAPWFLSVVAVTPAFALAWVSPGSLATFGWR